MLSGSLAVDCDNTFVGLEVGASSELLSGHPHTLALGCDRLRSAQVGQDDVAIEVAVIDELGRCIEARTTSQYALSFLGLTFLPSIHLVNGYLGIEWHNRELSNLGQLVQLREERGKHAIINRSRLVDRDSDLGLATDALARVNLWEPLVETARRRTLVSTLRGLDKVTKNFAPINLSRNAVHNVLTHARRNRAPVTRLLSFLGGLLDRFFESLLSDLLRGSVTLTELIV